MSEVASGVAEGRGSSCSDAAQAGLSGGSLKQVFKQSRNLGENEAYLPEPCHCSRELHSEYGGGARGRYRHPAFGPSRLRSLPHLPSLLSGNAQNSPTVGLTGKGEREYRCGPCLPRKRTCMRSDRHPRLVWMTCVFIWFTGQTSAYTRVFRAYSYSAWQVLSKTQTSSNTKPHLVSSRA